MLYFKDVPVVIEPGVAALEVAIVNVKAGVERLFFVPFERVTPNSDNAGKLPFIVSSAHPHVFTMHKNLDITPFLLIYNVAGKLAMVYTRDEAGGNWVRNDAAPEQVGDTITKFSVRFSFNSAKQRNNFLSTLDGLIDGYQTANKISRTKVAAVLDCLLDSDTGPVVLPVAVAKKAAVN